MVIEDRHINPELVKDLQNRLGVSDLFCWINEQGDILARLGFVNGKGVEFTEAIRKARRIKNICPGSIAGEDAYIRSVAGHYTIFYKEHLPMERMRYAIAHEIGHTYWFAPGGGVRPLSTIQRSLGRDPSIEFLCDKFAAALLLPREQVTKRLRESNNERSTANYRLDAIPKIAKEFRVAEKAVARRIFFELFPKKLVILSVRRNEGENKWKLSWCALPFELRKRELVEDIRIPLIRSGRVIPPEMIPAVEQDETKECLLDGRWWNGVQGKHRVFARKPFSRLPPEAPRKGYVYRIGNSLYITLLL